jgi:hypothetical protein
MTCIHRGAEIGTTTFQDGVTASIYRCAQRSQCTEQDHGLKILESDESFPACVNCQMRKEPSGKLLTIGMAYYRDWPGLWATIQSLRLHHQEAIKHIEIVVVDNDPNGDTNEASESNHSWKAKQLCERIGARYEHYTKIAGTAAAKGRIFDIATGEWVTVIDCHVLFPAMVLDVFLEHIRQLPADCNDLIQGPLIGDGGIDDIIGTHMREGWGSLMYGQWSVDNRVHDSFEPFGIPMHGCGLFAMRQDKWVGFHPLLRGFGPEEWHLHQRVRRAGGRCLCLHVLRWCHRFGNPDGAKPPGLAPEERLRGHLITWLDTGNGNQEWFTECKKHFLASGMTEKMFAQTVINTRREFEADKSQLQNKLRADSYPCSHRREQVRVDPRPPCSGGPQPIYGCDIHGECSIGRYCTRQTVRACTSCADREFTEQQSA